MQFYLYFSETLDNDFFASFADLSFLLYFQFPFLTKHSFPPLCSILKTIKKWRTKSHSQIFLSDFKISL